MYVSLEFLLIFILFHSIPKFRHRSFNSSCRLGGTPVPQADCRNVLVSLGQRAGYRRKLTAFVSHLYNSEGCLLLLRHPAHSSRAGFPRCALFGACRLGQTFVIYLHGCSSLPDHYAATTWNQVSCLCRQTSLQTARTQRSSWMGSSISSPSFTLSGSFAFCQPVPNISSCITGIPLTGY